MDDNRVIPAINEDFQGIPVDQIPPPSERIEYGTRSTTSSATSEPTSSFNDAGGYGYDPGANINIDTSTLQEFTIMGLIQMFVVYAFIIAAALSAVFIFIGGVSFILSGGNDEKIKQAINTIRYSIIGLIVTILSFTFVTIVGRMFGLNFMDYLKYGTIRDSINQLVSPFRSQSSSDNFEIRQ